ncbi:uncharacterized protein TNCV_2531021 [Trichonephila clavipes]|nr:uncharacterized protein TNCV_2531021 [Trichonephila clavipes]
MKLIECCNIAMPDGMVAQAQPELRMPSNSDVNEVRIEIILNSSKKSSSGAVMKPSDNFEIKTKKPPLVLPQFSGKYEEFSSFKVQFDDLITNNTQQSQSQKLNTSDHV